VLFAVGGGAGLFGGDDSDKDTQKKWQDRFAKPAKVRLLPNEVTPRPTRFTGSLDEVFVVPQGAGLEFAVAPTDRRMRMRTLELTLVIGAKARVKWYPDKEKEPLLDIPMRPGKAVQVQVAKEGGKFVLICEQGAGVPPMARVKME
jgi:hypothetical protein